MIFDWTFSSRTSPVRGLKKSRHSRASWTGVNYSGHETKMCCATYNYRRGVVCVTIGILLLRIFKKFALAAVRVRINSSVFMALNKHSWWRKKNRIELCKSLENHSKQGIFRNHTKESEIVFRYSEILDDPMIEETARNQSYHKLQTTQQIQPTFTFFCAPLYMVRVSFSAGTATWNIRVSEWSRVNWKCADRYFSFEEP